MYLNKVYVIGNLTSQPEVKAMPGGGSVSSFSIATNRVWKDAKTGEKKTQAEFHNIVVFGKSAELCAQYLKKGSQALIEGRLQTRTWDGPDGKKNYKTEIIADTVQFGSRPPEGGTGYTAPQTESTSFDADPFPSSGSDSFGSVVQYPDENFNPSDIPF